MDYFSVKARHTEGRFLYELGEAQWDIPKLRTLLDEVLQQRKDFLGYEVDLVFPTIGRKTVKLDARSIRSSLKNKRVILLSFHALP